MAVSVSSIISDVQEHFPDINVSDCMNLLNKIHYQLCNDQRLIPEGHLDVPLISGQLTYAFDTSTLIIRDVSYYSSSTLNAFPMKGTSIDELDYLSKGWRIPITGQPTRYYVDGNQIGFYPVTNTTSVSGIPFCRISYVAFTPLSSSGYLPDQVLYSDAWTYGVCMKWAVRFHQDKIAIYRELYQEEKNALGTRANNTTIRVKPKIRPRITGLRQP